MAIPKQFKVSVLEAPKKMVVKTIKTPAIGPDEILVKVEGCGICGTDVHEYKGDPFKFCPIQLGHEGTGEIVALGKNVTKDFTGPAPRSRAASTSVKSILSTALWQGRIMKEIMQ